MTQEQDTTKIRRERFEKLKERARILQRCADYYADVNLYLQEVRTLLVDELRVREQYFGCDESESVTIIQDKYHSLQKQFREGLGSELDAGTASFLEDFVKHSFPEVDDVRDGGKLDL